MVRRLTVFLLALLLLLSGIVVRDAPASSGVAGGPALAMHGDAADDDAAPAQASAFVADLMAQAHGETAADGPGLPLTRLDVASGAIAGQAPRDRVRPGGPAPHLDGPLRPPSAAPSFA